MEVLTRADEKAHRWLSSWIRQIGIQVPVRLERTSIWHVTGEGGRRGCSLVGVVLDEERACCIYHTRRLTQEDIVHELLHVAYPCWSEEAVIEETARLLATARSRRRLPPPPSKRSKDVLHPVRPQLRRAGRTESPAV